MRGPLPDPSSRRRNAPAIPTTSLPASGRSDTVPRAPKGYALGDAGRAWWRWAWRLPHAAAWSTGDLYLVARRAGLEDDLVALAAVEGPLCLDGVAEEDLASALEAMTALVMQLKALAAGKLSVLREARELDDRLGLSPKGMAALRWRIVAVDGSGSAGPGEDEVARRRAERDAQLAAYRSAT